MLAGLDEDDLLAEPGGCHGRDHAAGGAAIDEDVRLRVAAFERLGNEMPARAAGRAEECGKVHLVASTGRANTTMAGNSRRRQGGYSNWQLKL